MTSYSFTQAEVSAKTVAYAKADTSFGEYLRAWARQSGPIGDARFKAEFSDKVDHALAKAWPGDDANTKAIRATRKAWVKAVLVGVSNGIDGPVSPQRYYEGTKDAMIAKGLRKPSKAGAKAGARAAKATEQKAQTPKGREHLAMTLTGNAEIAAFLIKSLETGERDQTFKYLRERFGTK